MVTPLPLVLGTHNQKKLKELKECLPADRFRLMTLADFPQALEVDETGTTFPENAALKATVQAKHLNHWVLAEDSGLCVDGLGGAPGVISARFAGLPSNDLNNNALLLERLKDLSDASRNAHYECHLCLASPDGEVILTGSGSCHGRILRAGRGEAGFGYDPLFEVIEYHQTFAELGAAVKRAISHRARALRGFVPQMLRLSAELIADH